MIRNLRFFNNLIIYLYNIDSSLHLRLEQRLGLVMGVTFFAVTFN